MCTIWGHTGRHGFWLIDWLIDWSTDTQIELFPVHFIPVSRALSLTHVCVESSLAWGRWSKGCVNCRWNARLHVIFHICGGIARLSRPGSIVWKFLAHRKYAVSHVSKQDLHITNPVCHHDVNKPHNDVWVVARKTVPDYWCKYAMDSIKNRNKINQNLFLYKKTKNIMIKSLKDTKCPCL